MPKGIKSLENTTEKDTNDLKEEDYSESILRQMPVESGKECVTFVCPVCGKSVSNPHLPDVQSVITEEWYFVQRTRIVSSKVVFEHEFDHCHDEEEDSGMEELHKVVAVISAEFDGTGKCTVFDILEIRPCDTEDSMKKIDGSRRWVTKDNQEVES